MTNKVLRRNAGTPKRLNSLASMPVLYHHESLWQLLQAPGQAIRFRSLNGLSDFEDRRQKYPPVFIPSLIKLISCGNAHYPYQRYP